MWVGSIRHSAQPMSEAVDLKVVSELLRDLSLQVKKLEEKDNGESSSTGEPARAALSTGKGDLGAGAGDQFWRIPDCSSGDSTSLRESSSSGSGRGSGLVSPRASSYREAVYGATTVIVTPTKARKGVMSSTRSGVIFNQQPPPLQQGQQVPPPPPPVAMANVTVEAFEAHWVALADDAARQAYENQALAQGSAEVKVASLIHRDQRQAASMQAVQAQLAQAQQAAIAAQAAANAVAAAPVVNGEGAPRAAPPPRFENKEKEMRIREWIPLVQDYLRNTPNEDYLRMASSYLSGKPRSYWMSKYEAFKTEHALDPVGPEPPNPRQFFKDTMERGYGLRDETQTHWDTWNKLRQAPGQSIDEYNVAFEQALVDLNGQLNDEPVKIEKYREGLQADLREMCRTSIDGTRWTSLEALATYATLQWPTIEARIAKRREKPPAAPSSTRVGGKRKASVTSPPRARGGESKRFGTMRLSLSDEEHAKNMKDRLCHICKSPNHQYRQCPEYDDSKYQKSGPPSDKKDRRGGGGKGKRQDFPVA